ncbi:MAG: hypothetical protein ACYDB1_03800 [Acidiferrobacteraceae bacterium]
MIHRRALQAPGYAIHDVVVSFLGSAERGPVRPVETALLWYPDGMLQ